MTYRVRMFSTRNAIAFSVFAIAQILAGAPESLAQPFSLNGLGEDQGAFEPGEIEFEVNSAYQSGFPTDAEEATRFASELSMGVSLTDFLNVESGLSLSKAKDDSWKATNVSVEVTLAPPMLRGPDFGVGLFMAVEPRINKDATNEFAYGPIIQAGGEDSVQLTLNPFLEKTFGRNREEGTAFSYAWQLKGNVSEGVALGLEGYGEIEDVFRDAPAASDQVHRIGPVIYLGGEAFGAEREFEVSFGVLAGLTRATPDVALALNFEIPFGSMSEM